ncbi:MAG: FAA hydrolase family protein [Chloroflexi bacterium]|nr:FAA hydrolase family protein [Chloroflexota bacterium]
MKLVLFQPASRPDAPPQAGLLLPQGVVDLSSALGPATVGPTDRLMQRVIEHFDTLRSQFEALAASASPLPMSSIRLRAPITRPGKILNCIGNYWEHAQRDPRPLNMFLKNPDAVIGEGDTIVLPEFTEPEVFQHEAELGLVLKGPSKQVAQADWQSAVFGYTCFIDVSARAAGRGTWRSGSWMGKSFDTFGPMGPCILTADEVEDPNRLHVQFWNSGGLMHDYSTEDMEHRVPELIEFATAIMTLNNGDLISCGTNHEGLGPLQDEDVVSIEIGGIGRLTVKVADPLKRSWPRGIYMGPNSTNPAAVAQRNAST